MLLGTIIPLEVKKLHSDDYSGPEKKDNFDGRPDQIGQGKKQMRHFLTGLKGE